LFKNLIGIWQKILILKYRLCIYIVFFSAFTFGQQKPDNLLRQKKIKLTQKQIKIDTFSIQPFFLEMRTLEGKKIPPEIYHVDFVKAILFLDDYKALKNKEVWIYYLAYPDFLHQTYQKYSLTKIREDSLKTISIIQAKPQIMKVKPFDGLKTQGKITREFNTGNRQNVVMQSGLDLKISGNLSPKLKINAVLSDDNLPQAYAGISQSYKEFNQIYLQLSAPKWQATGGDLFLDEQPGYFLKFTRKTQGLSISFKSNKNNTQLQGGVVNGQYGINRFTGIDGNQGPYVLKGNKGENYIFIIPKSEKIYINGRLLKRNKDYLLNYETAELHFQPDFPITSNQRITVTFNYANQHYVRYTNYNCFEQKNNRFLWSVYTFLETDAKNQTLLYDLTAQEKEVLKNAGDKVNDLWITAAKPSLYDPHKILYRKKNNGTVTYFEYADQDLPDLYEVRFTYVGHKRGSYKIEKITAIGKIYKFVGENQGEYLPAIRLTPPEKRQYAGFKIKAKPTTKTNWVFDGLLNYTDQNLFSQKDDHDNLGGALHFEIVQSIWQQKNNSLSLKAKYNFTHTNFIALDPYYNIEFNRDWQIDSLYGQQHFVDLNLTYIHQKNTIQFGSRYLSLRQNLNAQQIYYNANWQRKNWTYQSKLHYTSRRNLSKLQALYTQHNWIYFLPKTKFEVNGNLDFRNQKKGQVYDSLNYRYTSAGLSWQKRDSLTWNWQILYQYEKNDSIKNDRWQNTEQTNNFGVKIGHHGKKHQVKLFIRYRLKHLTKNQPDQKFLNLKFVWQQTYLQQLFKTNVQLESFNGNTLRDEIIFVETPAGQGRYLWNDYNGNGLKEINEFEVAPYSDQANYIRVILPGKKYLPTLNNSYQIRLIFNPAVWQNRKLWQHLYGQIKFMNRHQSIKTNNFSALIWQPENILTQQLLHQQDWYWNRGKKRYQLHFLYRFHQQKQLLSIGIQSHQSKMYQLIFKHYLKKQWQWQQQFWQFFESNFAENYHLKNFDLKNTGIEEGFAFKNKHTEFYLYSKYQYKQNLSGMEQLNMYQVGLKINTHQKKTSSQFNIDLKYIRNDFKGNPLTPVSFKMLEALQPGHNVVSQVLYQKNLNSYLQMSLNTGFRFSKSAPPVYTGGIRFSMNF